MAALLLKIESVPVEEGYRDAFFFRLYKTLANYTDVVGTRRKRHACSSCLWQPPEAADPLVVAGHHPLADKIHHGRAHLRRGIKRVRMRKGPQQRVRFRPIASGNRAPRRPCVKCGSCVASRHQGIPDLLLARRFILRMRRRFDRRAWCECGRGFGCECRIRLHLRQRRGRQSRQIRCYRRLLCRCSGNFRCAIGNCC